MEKQGFTLIELLVLVSFICLLSIILVIIVQRPELEASDINIKTYLYQVQSAAEMHYAKGGVEDYTSLCASDNTLNDSGEFGVLERVIRAENGEKPVSCYASVNNFAVSSPLRLGEHWCVESIGIAIEIPCQINSVNCLGSCP